MRHRLLPRHLATCVAGSGALQRFLKFIILSLHLSTQYKFGWKQKQDSNDLLHEFLNASRTAHRTHAHIYSECGERYITALFAFAANGRQRAAIERETRTVYRLKLNVTLWRRRTRRRRSTDQLNVSEKFKILTHTRHPHTRRAE